MLVRKSDMVYEAKGEIDGQLVMVRFERDDWDEKGLVLWYTLLYIGDGMKGYKRWLKAKNYNEEKAINGIIGLKGLRFALQMLLSLQQQLKENELIVITGSDSKRYRAYRYLLRYEAFEEVKYEKKDFIAGFPFGKEETIKQIIFNEKKRWKA